MLCSECEKVLDLDISFPAISGDDSDDEEASQRISHYESYPVLCRAAAAGCELCQHITQKYRGGIVEDVENSEIDPRMRVTFEVLSDSLIFYIPMRVEYDDTGESYDLGEESVKVYISTDESLLFFPDILTV